MRPLYLFRPEPGWTVTAQTARAMDMDVCGAPLFAIEPVAWDAPAAEGFDGLLVGSANVFRHGGKALERYRALPVHAVGETTASAARAAGFIVGQSGRGGLQALIDAMAGRTQRLLRLAGEERVRLALPEGIAVETRAVYRAVPQALADDDAARLGEDGGVVALHSGEAARRFAGECARLGIDRARVALVVIGPRVAALAGAGWQAVHTAAAPGDSEVLALAKALCHARAGMGGADRGAPGS